MKYNTLRSRSFVIAIALCALSVQASEAAHHRPNKHHKKLKQTRLTRHSKKSDKKEVHTSLKHETKSKPVLHPLLQAPLPAPLEPVKNSLPLEHVSTSSTTRTLSFSSTLEPTQTPQISQNLVSEQNTDLNSQELQKYFSNLKVLMQPHRDDLSISLLGKTPTECLSLFQFQAIDLTTSRSQSCGSSAGWIISDPDHQARDCINQILEQTHTLCSTLHPCSNLSDQDKTRFNISSQHDVKLKHFQRNDSRDRRDEQYLECSDYDATVADPVQTSYKTAATLKAESDAIQATQEAQHRAQTLLQISSCRSSVQEIRTVAQPMLELAQALEYMSETEARQQSEALQKLEKTLLVKEIETASPERLIEIRDELLEEQDAQDSTDTQTTINQNLASIIQHLMQAEQFELAHETAVLATNMQPTIKDIKHKFLNYQVEIKVSRALALIKANAADNFVTPMQVQQIINQAQNNVTDTCRAVQVGQQTHLKHNQVDKTTCTQSIALLQRASLLHQQAQQAVNARTQAEMAMQGEIQQALMSGLPQANAQIPPQPSPQMPGGYHQGTMPPFMNMPGPNTFTPPFMGSLILGNSTNMPLGMPMYL